MKKPVFKRVLLKLSGEALQGDQSYGVDPKVAFSIAQQIKEVRELGVDLACVIGGGNIFRGLQASKAGMDRATADYIGMLATIMNSMVLQDALEKIGVHTRVQSALEIKELAEPYIRRRAMRHLEKGRVIIFAGGTGNPYFTTDTAAALRAIEIGADVILKATKVDGVYDKDPVKHKDAVKHNKLSLQQAVENDQIKVMDKAAIGMALEHNMPIVIFDAMKPDSIVSVAQGKSVGTTIS